METLYSATPEHQDIIQESFKQPDWEDAISMTSSHFQYFWVNFSCHENVAVVGGTFSPHGCSNELLEKLFVEFKDVVFQHKLKESDDEFCSYSCISSFLECFPCIMIKTQY